jgi:predicted ATP-binding protein involved in virulence
MSKKVIIIAGPNGAGKTMSADEIQIVESASVNRLEFTPASRLTERP